MAVQEQSSLVVATGAAGHASGSARTLPLVVDLDGTLLATDTLFECIASCLRVRPLWTLWMMLQLPFAIARVKRAIQQAAVLDVARMPVNQDVLDYARAARAEGRPVWLVSAADQSIVDKAAAAFGPFDRAIGSDGKTNNKGSNKARQLTDLLPDGFEYVGDSPADRKVWSKASAASVVGSDGAARAYLQGTGATLVRRFAPASGGFKAWRKALRLHQWAKNVLLFVAPALAMTIQDPDVFLRVLAGFFCLGVVASGTYLLNDLVDLDADRAHHSKKTRPFAAGRIKLWHGFVAAPALILAGFAGAFAVSLPFAVTLLAYLILTLSYSLFLKRKPMVDVVLLAFLYTLRLIMGGVIADVPVTEWLIVFSMFLFLSLSFAKRFVEVGRKAAAGETHIQNRGYRISDASLIEAMGLATAVASPIILVLYITAPTGPAAGYAYAGALWAAPALLSLWLMRIWLLAHRFELDDDPVVFAVKDGQSLAIGAMLLGAFLLAAFGIPGVTPDAAPGLAPVTGNP